MALIRHGTLTPNTISQVNFEGLGGSLSSIRVINRAPGSDIYYTTDNTDPSIGGPNTYVAPPDGQWISLMDVAGAPTKLISAGGQPFTVEGNPGMGTGPQAVGVGGVLPVSGTVLVSDVARTAVVLTANAVTSIVTETALALVPYLTGVNGSSANTYTVPAGKTLRVTSMTASLAASLSIGGSLQLRAAPTGTASTSSPLVLVVGFPIAGMVPITIPEGLDFPTGYSLLLSQKSTLTTGSWTVSIIGYLL